MPVQTCTCGAQYRVKEAAFGKEVKCKKCGETMTLGEAPAERDEGIIAFADDGLMDEFAAAAERGRVEEGDSSQENIRFDTRSDISKPILQERGGKTGGTSFAQAVIKSFLFPLTIKGFLTWLGLCIALFLGALVKVVFFGWILSLLVSGWYAAYRFEVIGSAANGEDDLPPMGFEDGLWDGVLAPFFAWTFSWIVVMSPAMAYAWFDSSVGMDGLRALIIGSTSAMTAGSSSVAAFTVCLLIGLFFWPIIALCISIGGVDSLTRFDLIVKTVFRTFPAYFMVVAVVFGAFAINAQLVADVADKIVPADSDAGISAQVSAGLLMKLVAAVVGVYFQIATVRVIGTYYHHYKSRFAWDWG